MAFREGWTAFSNGKPMWPPLYYSANKQWAWRLGWRLHDHLTKNQ